MGTPLQAMIWELWRTSRVDLLLRMGGFCALIVLLHGFRGGRVLGDPETHVISGVVLGLFLTAGSISSPSWIMAFDAKHKGFTFRLGFVRPVSTSMLVAVPMAFSVATAVITFLLPAWIFCLLEGLSRPLLGQATIIACLVACLMAAAWAPTTRWGKAIAVVALGIGTIILLFAFFAQRGNSEPLLMKMGRPEFFDFGWQAYALCLVMTVLAFAVTVIGVERQRHGDRWQPDGLRRLWRRENKFPERRQRPFTSPFAAQCWYEARRFGPTILALGVIGAFLVLSLAILMSRFDPGLKNSPTAWLVALFFCPFAYQLVGPDGALGLSRKQGAVWYSPFDAARAMSNDRLIACKLLIIAACSFIAWLCMVLAAGLHAALAGNWHEWQRIGEVASSALQGVPFYWWVAGLSSAVLLYISSTSMFLAFGLWLPQHGRLFLGIAVTLYLHFGFGIWAHHNDWNLLPLWNAYGYVLAVAIVVGCVVTLRKALVAGLLGKQLFGCAFCLWVVYVGSTVALYIKLAPMYAMPPVVIALGISMLLAPLATTAFAPLALTSHRHA